jgi:hypothetical protein
MQYVLAGWLCEAIQGDLFLVRMKTCEVECLHISTCGQSLESWHAAQFTRDLIPENKCGPSGRGGEGEAVIGGHIQEYSK